MLKTNIYLKNHINKICFWFIIFTVFSPFLTFCQQFKMKKGVNEVTLGAYHVYTEQKYLKQTEAATTTIKK